MVLLHIAYIDDNLCAGVNTAVKSFITTQSNEVQAALLNLASQKASITDEEFLISRYPQIKQLPQPFSHPDLIIFHELYRPAFLKLYVQADKLHIPYIIIPHGGLTKQAQSIKRLKKNIANTLLFNRFIRKAQMIQYLSEKERSESICIGKEFVAPNSMAKVYPPKTYRRALTQIVFVGRLDIHIKGIDLLLEAIKICKNQLIAHQVTIDLYGPDENGSYQRITDYIKREQLGAIVAVNEPVIGREKESVLRKADCFIQTSRSEGMPMGILEALSYGLPCILTDGTSMTDLIIQYQAGWACKTNPTDIAFAIMQAIKLDNDFNAISINAVKLVEENFLASTVTAKTLAQYKLIIADYQR